MLQALTQLPGHLLELIDIAGVAADNLMGIFSHLADLLNGAGDVLAGAALFLGAAGDVCTTLTALAVCWSIVLSAVPACWASSVRATLPCDSAIHSSSFKPRVSD